MRTIIIISSLALLLALSDDVKAQNDFTAKYDDVEIRAEELPDPLIFNNGKKSSY